MKKYDKTERSIILRFHKALMLKVQEWASQSEETKRENEFTKIQTNVQIWTVKAPSK